MCWAAAVLIFIHLVIVISLFKTFMSILDIIEFTIVFVSIYARVVCVARPPFLSLDTFGLSQDPNMFCWETEYQLSFDCLSPH